MRRIASRLILALLFLSLFMIASTIKPARAQSGENIVINPDGSISSAVPANITSSDNVTYAFTGNNYQPIVVNRSNITVNGNGYTLQASESNGFSLSHVNNVTIRDTTITNSNVGIYLWYSSGNVLSGDNLTANSNYGIWLEYSSGNTLSGNNVTANNSSDGIYLSYFCDNNTLSGNNIISNSHAGGIDLLYSSSDNTLSGNTVTASGGDGFGLYYSSSNNTLSDNTATANMNGIGLFNSSGDVLSCNNVTNNSEIGVNLATSSNCTVTGNKVANNLRIGVLIGYASGNRIFHNDFLYNTQQAFVYDSNNTWDDGYPSGGNYWSNYEGTDLYSGPYQNITGSDGIGDTPYTINANNTDHYPLMHPWSSLPVHDINTGLGYATIQEALDALQTLNGHTIFLDEGIYYENIVIDKAITLVGANQQGTIIDGKGEENVIQIKADNVNLMNLNIRNAGRNWGPPPGKGYPDSCISASFIVNASVENCTLSDAAVCAWFEASSSARVTDCIVSNATYMGLVGYACSNTTFQDNLVASCGAVGLHFDGGSTNCKMVNNTVTNSLEGIEVERSAGNFVEGNQLVNNNVSIWINNCVGLNVFRNNNMTSDEYNLIVWGWSLESFEQDIDTSNIVNSKTVYYITNSHDLFLDPSDCPNPGYLAIVNCSSVTVRNIDLSHSTDGLLIAQSTDCTFMNITISGNRGPLLWGGLTFFDSSDNSVTNSRISNNSVAVCLYGSSGNIFYHNSFVEISNPVISNFYSPSWPPSGSNSTNAWDNGYPSGGNYWSDYQTTYPNATEIDNSGIWNTPYVIDINNTDRYPLMAPFNSFKVTWDSQIYTIDTISNSTLSNFSFDATIKTLTFNVTGTSGSVGLCRIAIPKSLMSCDTNAQWIVTLNGTQILPPTLNVTTDANYTYIYFTYHHSTQMVKITSTSAVPEFQPSMLLPLFMIITLLGAVAFKKRATRTRC